MAHSGTGVRFTRVSPSTMKLAQIASALNARLDNGSGGVAQAFDLFGITTTVGAPSFAFFAKSLP